MYLYIYIYIFIHIVHCIPTILCHVMSCHITSHHVISYLRAWRYMYIYVNIYIYIYICIYICTYIIHLDTSFYIWPKWWCHRAMPDPLGLPALASGGATTFQRQAAESGDPVGGTRASKARWTCRDHMIWPFYMHKYLYMYIYIYIIYAYRYKYIYIYIYIHVYTYIYIYMCVCVWMN